MDATGYGYTARPTRNPLRYARSVWRLIREDPSGTTDDAAIVEIGFARSRWGRRFARWEEAVEVLKRDPRTAEALSAARVFGRIDLAVLEGHPPGSLGRVFAEHCRSRGIDPNLVQIPPDGEVGWLLNTLYQTHDIWHVVTGWGNDLEGEVGLGAFYAAQLGSPAFFGYMLSLVFLNVVWRRADLDSVFAAISSGYRAGKSASPLMSVDWNDCWAEPLCEIRERLGLEPAEIGEGILAAA